MTTDHIDIAELAVSELVTNSVTHATRRETRPARPTDGLLLVLLHMGSHVIIEVFDGSDTQPVSTGLPPWYVEAGRGLFIVDTLCNEWGYRPFPTGGKVVWCAIAFP